MNSIKSLAKQTLIYGLSNMVARFMNYLLVPIHTIVLGKFFYGKLTYIYSVTAIFLVLLTYGLETGFFRFASKKDEKFKEIFSTSFLSILVTTATFVLIALIFKHELKSFFYIDRPVILVYVIFILAFDVLSAIPFARLRIEERPVKFMFVKSAGIFVNIVLNLFFLVFCRKMAEAGSTSYFASLYNSTHVLDYVLIANLLSSLIVLVLLSKELSGVLGNFRFNVLKRMLRYSFPILIMGLAGMLNDNIDKILLPKLISDANPIEQLGIYGANFKLAILMVLFIQMYRYAAEPFFFNNSNQKDAKLVYAKVMKFFVIFGLIIFLGVNFFLDLFKFFIDEDFWDGLNVVPILLLAKLFFGIVFSLSIWYKITDKTYIGTIISFVGILFTIVLNVVLVPKIGYLGSAYASLISYFVMLLLSYYLCMKHYPIPYDLKKIGSYFVLAAVVFFIQKSIRVENNYVIYIINIILLSVFVFIAYNREKKYLNESKVY